MKFATGLQRRGADFSALGLDALGNATHLESATKLHARGLPSEMEAEVTADFELAGATEEPLHSYMEAFGMTPTQDLQHLGWAVNSAGETFIVPALALIRGLFAPASSTLQHALRYQSLRELAAYDVHTHEMKFINAKLGNPSSAETLRWVHCFPSAWRSWCSVFQFALAGWIGMSMPAATIRVSAGGIRRDGIFYVTHLSVISIDVHEESFEFSDGRPPRLARKDGLKFVRRTLPLAKADGSTFLDDDEWEAVIRIFSRPSVRYPYDFSPRILIDLMLGKLCSTTSWTRAPRSDAVGAVNVVQVYAAWQASGLWAEITDALRPFRQHSSRLQGGFAQPTRSCAAA